MKSDLETLSEAEVQSQIAIKVLPAQKSRLPKNKSDLGANFIAPDGGWGWLVVIAAAISILVTFAVLEQFEIVFKQRLESIGISSSQMTTIINTQLAAATCTALFNGAMFRRFTFCQIGLAGAICIFFGLALTAFADSFMLCLLTVSIMCGIGRSLIFSSSYIAVNTYFKENIRLAIACVYAIAGLGPIFLPYLTTFLMGECGLTWAILIYAGLSLHNFPSALVYQPVKLHLRKQRDIELVEVEPLNLVFGSRHIAKLSALENSTNSNNDLNSLYPLSTNAAYPLRVPKNSFASFEPLSRSIPKIILPDETEYFESPQDIQESPAVEKKKLSILQRISAFLDLDLLKDFSYINLVLGLTLMHFVETNYTLLMPFILNNSGCTERQITIAMAVLALCDMLMRISIPIVTRNLRCSNKVILLCAFIGMCIARTILVLSNNFTVLLICFGWMGLCTAIRTVFWMLILPSYMSLKRLPAGLGLQQVATGLCVLIFGQFRGLVEDVSHYSSVLLCINGIYLFVLMACLGDDFLKRKKKYKIPPIK